MNIRYTKIAAQDPGSLRGTGYMILIENYNYEEKMTTESSLAEDQRPCKVAFIAETNEKPQTRE